MNECSMGRVAKKLISIYGIEYSEKLGGAGSSFRDRLMLETSNLVRS